ncbi:MAG: hypothetical protein PHR36_03485 [Patescibacteria group bacterium]|nr:hypothetical protein [Patescibacteria group bacterium]
MEQNNVNKERGKKRMGKEGEGHKRLQRQPRIEGRPRGCAEEPGGGACRKMQSNNPGFCQRCAIPQAIARALGSFDLPEEGGRRKNE